MTTAVLPAGWQDRLVVLDTVNTAPGRGLCLERHDLVASKLAAGREKDHEFAAALLRDGLVDGTLVAQRIASLPIDEARRSRALAWVDARS